MQPARIQRLGRNERLAAQAGFWWGLAEGTFFFIVPDVYISFATLFALRAGAVAWVSSIAGSLVAVVVISLLMTMGVDYPGFLQRIPGISGGLIERVHASLAAGGLPYTPFLAAGGVPLKLYAATAFSLGIPLGAVVIWTVFARIVRIAPGYGVTSAIRVLFGRWIDARPGAWFAGFALFWIAFYTFYFIRMRG